MENRKYTVLVVDDSFFMTQFISDLLHQDPDIQVVGTAFNGAEALEKAEKLGPDVITMDVEMPVMNGLEALREIMRKTPTPVIMLSNCTQIGAESTIKALELGAVDFVTKPSGQISLDLEKVQDELIKKVKIAADAKKMLYPGNRVTNEDLRAQNKITENEKTAWDDGILFQGFNPARMKVVAIGASTGGPKALQTILPQLPENFPAAVIVAQHMPSGFTRSLASRLNEVCPLTVKEAEDGERLQPGTVYISPGGWHTVIQEDSAGCFVRLQENKPPTGNCPSIDTLMASLARCKVSKIGLLLTGMGKDGVVGLQQIQANGGLTIVEDKSTCIIFGMPKAAIENGCADYVVPVSDVAKLLLELLN
ncbi:response regulator receiver modulated CheB methylesterase [Thermincola ferriacetica]|uniref:Protein-glutamate methylesterase/protein-glutamine glutaminase n=1 Tax=Thermincola ferriacetica TaxID=281456 RepID=A0A0L6W6Y7_9FIRM|nr:chemotaxis response regulator protein-glutamate methylesterase [Thermincola ferriacetica]KNZ70864.1 response regulator receiver modulated CheB methylesterase [Thermincola ferriacetica]